MAEVATLRKDSLHSYCQWFQIRMEQPVGWWWKLSETFSVVWSSPRVTPLPSPVTVPTSSRYSIKMKQIKATTFSKATLLNEFNGFGWLIQFVGVQKETKETFLESLLNTCQESFQERDRLLRSAGSSQSWVAFINFLNEMYLQVTLASSLWINQPISYHTLPLRSYVSNPRFQISLINIHETGETLFVEPLKCNLYQCKLVIPDKIFETCVHLKLRRENPFFFLSSNFWIW